MPQPLHLVGLREEAVAAEVEAVAVALDGAREAADLRVGLEDDDRLGVAGEDIAGRQPGRPRAEDGDRMRLAGGSHRGAP